MKQLEVHGLVIGEGVPKICVPIVGENKNEIEKALLALSDQRFDFIEWRMDCVSSYHDVDTMLELASWLRQETLTKPLLITLRGVQDGGNSDLDTNAYKALYKALIDNKCADIIDLEYRMGEAIVEELHAYALAHQVKTIVSMHYFNQTPSYDKMMQDMKDMQALGGDIVKLAVMPSKMQDVLRLLEATQTMHNEYAIRPLITMAMGELGTLSRISGEFVGSSVTFASGMKQSAPGQLPIEEVKTILEILHNRL